MTRTVTGLRRDQVTYGAGAVERLGDIAAHHGAERVLIVTGRASFEASGAAACLDRLNELATVERWSDFAPNTDAADLVNGLAIVADFNPDLIVGIGGGSPMDMAKLLIAYDTIEPGDTDALHEAIKTNAKVEQRRRGLMLIPTTSGSGSEATHFAVVYIGDDKYSIAGPAMRPDAVILDPLLAMSGSRHQRATSGVDALCQSIESLWAVGATEESRRYARYGLALVSKHIREFVNAPNERAVRAMCIGSHLAGRAIDISKTTAAHALSYAITKRYGIDHGNAVALTLGAFIEEHDAILTANQVDRLQVDPAVLRASLQSIGDMIGTPSAGRSCVASLLAELSLPASLREAGIRDHTSAIQLADSVNVERLGNNPVAMSLDQLNDLLTSLI